MVVKSGSGMNADSLKVFPAIGDETHEFISSLFGRDLFFSMNCWAQDRSSRLSLPRKTMAHSHGCIVSAWG